MFPNFWNKPTIWFLSTPHIKPPFPTIRCRVGDSETLARSALSLRRVWISFVCFLKAFFSALVNLLAHDLTALEVAILDSKFTEETSDLGFAGSALIRFQLTSYNRGYLRGRERLINHSNRSDGRSWLPTCEEQWRSCSVTQDYPAYATIYLLKRLADVLNFCMSSTCNWIR